MCFFSSLKQNNYTNKEAIPISPCLHKQSCEIIKNQCFLWLNQIQILVGGKGGIKHPKILELGITSSIKDKFSNSIFMPTVRQHSFLASGSLEATTESWLQDMLVHSYSNCSIKSMTFESWHSPDNILDIETHWTAFLNHTKTAAFWTHLKSQSF